MIVDFHTHSFPDAVAPRAVAGLAAGANMKSYSDGTNAGLKAALSRAGVDRAVLMPVVTKPHQADAINRAAVALNVSGGPLLSFGGVHPDCENYREIMKGLAEAHVPGVKLHPLFQGVAADDQRYLRIIEYAAELDLYVLIHAGLDPNYPGQDLASPKRLLNVLRQVPYPKIILAHLGGLGQWDKARALVGSAAFLDTACALYPWRDREGRIASHPEYDALTKEEFCAIVRAHGVDRVLFGSDSPWTDISESLSLIRASGLTEAELEAVLGGNAARILGLHE